MTPDAIAKAQQYLTMEGSEGVSRCIVDIETLLRRHPVEKVLEFLRYMQGDFENQLQILRQRDQSNPRISRIAAKLFRIKIAINTLRRYQPQV